MAQVQSITACQYRLDEQFNASSPETAVLASRQISALAATDYAKEPMIGGRRVSVYKTLTGKMIAIVTEADQRKTSIMLPDQDLLRTE